MTRHSWDGAVTALFEGHHDFLERFVIEIRNARANGGADTDWADWELFEFKTATSEFRRDVETLIRCRHDPFVLVQSGPNPRIYHSAESPCGRAPGDGRRLFWGEARKQGLQPCGACGGKADETARRNRRSAAS